MKIEEIKAATIGKQMYCDTTHYGMVSEVKEVGGCVIFYVDNKHSITPCSIAFDRTAAMRLAQGETYFSQSQHLYFLKEE